ncbi:DUF4175 family protein [Olivibacter sitiensis]|uniref:DUF4175 family protein n=1 Tax=Olivibacter sitiensis TaxID=376470 RepID=UPI000406BB71|nr:DUF4175 family protein [Olivibacter sitiensis]
MKGINGKQWISRWKNKWMFHRLIQIACYAWAAAFLIGASMRLFLDIGWFIPVLLGGMFFVGYLAFFKRWQMSEEKMAHLLDANFPALEHSASLFLQPAENLGILQNIQLSIIEKRIPELSDRDYSLQEYLKRSVPLLVCSIALYVLCGIFANVHEKNSGNSSVSTGSSLAQPNPSLPKRIAASQLIVVPPAYTGLPLSKQSDLSFRVPAGSSIKIQLTANTAVDTMKIIWNGKEELPLVSKGSNEWEMDFRALANGFYQINIDGELSPMYMMEVIPDLPVAITVEKPEPRTVIDPGFPTNVAVRAGLSDDYAISDVRLLATVASGKGESVRFQTKELDLPSMAKGQKTMSIGKDIQLKSLGMQPGDELYFYFSARDNAGQESKSDVYVVAWQDTSELMSMSGMIAGVDLVPEYFRSQRQIIIDTEKLLADMPKLERSEANNRSNNLGVDQKLLRLRYGQFLGEENESDIGGGHEHHEGDGHDHGNEVPEDVNVLMDQLTHHHDNAEDATFFTPEQKTLLKATLTEMWNAELRLRTFKPSEALPYAYKALRLLKDLQQSSRAYVGKTPSKTTPLKLDKRLGGDLSEITSPKYKKEERSKNENKEKELEIRKTLAWLSTLKGQRNMQVEGQKRWKELEAHLLEPAAKDPKNYLPALQAVRLIEEKNGKDCLAEINVLEKAVFRLLPTVQAKPVQSSTGKTDNIYNEYLKQIQP